jgi:D-hydroxyproline dehydrogenase subunit alpha
MSGAADVVIVGAGPAGLSGAVTAADGGCRVAVLDLAERPGGQYWRHPADALGGGPRGLHHGWAAFARLRDRFAAHAQSGRISYLPEHTVWRLDRDGQGVTARASAGERSPPPVTVRARTVLVATGAHDRHVPFEGWTLPGVVAVGGAQALLKGSLITPGRRIVVAGTGPFLLSVADGLLRAGADVAAIVEAGKAGGARSWLRGARWLRALPAVPVKLREAAGYAATIARHRVPYLTGQAVVEAHGPGRVQAVSVRPIGEDWSPQPGQARRIECDTLAVGFGFVPQLELLLQTGCETRLDRTGMLVAVVDGAQRTSVQGVYAAGEPTGVGGAELSLAEGALAGDAIARALGRDGALDARERARLRGRRERLRAFAAVLADAYPVRDGWHAWTGPQTTVCRCEEVTVAEISSAVVLGARDTRAVKLLARPGMGRCQGRICGAAVVSLAAGLNSRPVTAEDIHALAERPLAHPVTLEVLAQQGDDWS